jgi:hypothetical protein
MSPLEISAIIAGAFIFVAFAIVIAEIKSVAHRNSDFWDR